MSFIHLHCHSAYSLSTGAITIKQLAKLAKKMQMPALALTDQHNLFGALEFSLSLMENGIQPIIGCKINLLVEDNKDQLILLAKNQIGYENLLRLMTKSYLREENYAILTIAELEEAKEGLLVLSGGYPGKIMGTAARLILQNNTKGALVFLQSLQDIFKDHLYIEIMRHGLLQQEKIENDLLEIAYDLNIPLVATNEVYFDDKSMFKAHDALLCIADGKYISQADRFQVTEEHYFKSAEEMQNLFSDLPEAILNTEIIMQRCSFAPKASKPVLPQYGVEDEIQTLKDRAHAGLKDRLGQKTKKDYLARLEYELEVIISMGFAGYFLIVSDFIQWAKKQKIPVGPGRGSGAGSLVAWALTITDIDPIRFGLIFERFLNPERVSMPDFDIDFCQDRRDEVIKYVRQKYGDDRVAHIITFGKLQARAVVRDVGRVLQMPYGQVDKLSKLIPSNPANPVSLKEAIDGEPLLKEAMEEPQVAELMKYAMQLEGLYRHASTHAAGVVIGDLAKQVPLYWDQKSSLPATQFSMKYVELAGLVKFDFLGLKTLTIIQSACDIAGVDSEGIPLENKKTFKLLSMVDTVGIFQLESAGMRDVLRKLKPDRLEDLIALVALYRPGPMDDIPRYLACKHGLETVSYLHPDLEPILSPTYGVMVYQEQVMKIAQVLAGYTLGGADLLRRAMGKKIKSEMDAQQEQFVEGAIKRNIDKETAEKIFEQMAKFAGYGFNKSHAAPYALLTYLTAYLKANFPHAFMAATMSYDLNNIDKLMLYRQDLEKQHIALLPPNINYSQVLFSIENDAVRYALAAIKNVGQPAMESLVQERNKNGLFKNLEDFLRRIDGKALNKRQLENLIAAGALDSLEPRRDMLLENIENLLAFATQKQDQPSLFNIAAKLELTQTPPWGKIEILNREFAALGFFLSAHPLDVYSFLFPKMGITLSSDLAFFKERNIRVVGVLLAKQEKTTKKGSKFAFLQLSDPKGIYEVVVFSEVFLQNRNLLVEGKNLCINCVIRHDGEESKLTAQEIKTLEDALPESGGSLLIVVDSSIDSKSLHQLLESNGVGKWKICLEVQLNPLPVLQMHLPQTYNITPELKSQLMSLKGVLGITINAG